VRVSVTFGYFRLLSSQSNFKFEALCLTSFWGLIALKSHPKHTRTHHTPPPRKGGSPAGPPQRFVEVFSSPASNSKAGSRVAHARAVEEARVAFPKVCSRQLLGSFQAASRQLLDSFYAASRQLLGSF
jgi:hypothetical protein